MIRTAIHSRPPAIAVAPPAQAPGAAAAAAELVARYRRQRPLRGGSLIVTIFGDAILPRGGAIALGSLIALAAPFGLNERLVRTATARLAKDGWIQGRRAGKLSEYRLSRDGRERFVDATKRIYGEPDSEWSGRWTIIVLPPMRAAERKALKIELTWQGFGELAANVFAHPEPDSRSMPAPHGTPGPFSKAMLFEATLADGDAPERLVALGWDLEDLGRRYQRFAARFERVRDALAAARSLEPQACFVVRTLLIHEYRRLHLRDPLLPARLLQPQWPGRHAAALCREVYARVFAASEEYLSRQGAQLEGALPAPDASVMQRFGGIQFPADSPLSIDQRISLVGRNPSER